MLLFDFSHYAALKRPDSIKLLWKQLCCRSSKTVRRMGFSLLPLGLAIALAGNPAVAAPDLSISDPVVESDPIIEIEFIGQSVLPTNLVFAGTPLGGLSGITYDAEREVYYAISDDRSHKAPARFYTLKIDLSQGRLRVGGATPQAVTPLLAPNHQPFPPAQLDPEAIAFTQLDSVWIASEGDASHNIAPFVREFALNGQSQNSLPIPAKFLPNSQAQTGVRNNFAFESLTLTPDQRSLFVATESALQQDGPIATTDTGSPARILQYDLDTQQPIAEFLYLTDPIAVKGIPGGITMTGLSDLLAIDNRGHFLSIERSFAVGAGFRIQLFRVSLAGADNIQAIEALQSRSTVQPVQKQLLLDLQDLGIPLDNIEGLTLGPQLPDGSQSLIAIADNNFNPLQSTQILAFKLRILRD